MKRRLVPSSLGIGPQRWAGCARGSWLVPALFAGLLTVALVACGSRDVEPLELGSCGVEGPDHPERCGTFSVPLDWSDPGGAQMEIQVLVVPASGGDPLPDPLFVLAGFGQSAFGSAEWAYRNFRPLRQERDLVFVEQRGTGATAEFCPIPPGYSSDRDAIRAAVDDCLASLQRDPRHDTTASAVRDLDRARAALGYDEINLYGASYGVSMGLAYLQQYPGHVRTAVFDAGSLLDVRLWELGPTNTQKVLDATVEACAADADCAAAFDLAADLDAVLQQLGQAPISVDLGEGRSLTVDRNLFLDGIIDRYLADAAGRARFPAGIHALRRGSWSEVLLAQGGVPDSQLGDAPEVQAQTLTLRCSDEWARMDPSAVAAQAGSVFAPTAAARAAWQEAVCEVWPHDEGVGGTVQTNIPIVFLNGTLDPVDPPHNVAAATTTMPGALVVAVPGAGHGSLHEQCVLDRTIGFIQAGEPSRLDDWADCLDELADQPMRFVSG